MSDELRNVLTDSAFLAFASVLIGLVVGSFLNVVIYRLPVMMQREWQQNCAELAGSEPVPQERFNLVVPRSACPHCGQMVRAIDNIPLLSYLLLKGRCHHCGGKISPRYPVIEAFTALMTAITVLHFGFTTQAVFAVLLTWALIALTFIDLDHHLLPDDITLPFLWLGLGLSVSGVFVDSHTSIIGAIAGYVSLWSIYHLFRLVTGKEGMGYGDFKLFALFGAWLGWQSLALIIMLSSAVGAIVGISLILFRGHERSKPIPFGPYLAAAGWLALLWGEEMTTAYLRWMNLI